MLRRPTGGAALEGRLQDVEDSDFEGKPTGLGVGGTFGPPKDTPPEMTTVVDAVFGGAIGVDGIGCSVSPDILKVGAFGLRPVGAFLLPNLPPKAAVMGTVSISSSYSNECSRRLDAGGCDGILKVIWEGPAVEGMREPVLGARGVGCL